MRSSPQVRFWVAAMSRRTSVGMRGRPRRRDFSRQKRRKRSRCHRTSVSGRTIVKSSRHSTNCDRRTSVIREALSVRRGRVVSEKSVEHIGVD